MQPINFQQMKPLLTVLMAFAVYTGIAQPAYLKPDLSIPIPKLKFDAKGELVITASPTSSNKDFDYLIGKWTLKHRKLKSRFTHSDEWEEFDTVVEDFSILEGMGNMDIGRAVIDGQPWEGRTIRIFDPKTRLWRLHWIASSMGVMDPPVVGSFENGIGHFFTKDKFKGKPIIMMFRWDARNKEFPIWSQAFSPDNGKTWEWNWVNRSERYVDKQAAVFPYPMPSPDTSPQTFLPGIVSKDSVDFGSAFSPDQQSFYFARSENKRSAIYVTHWNGSNWSTPQKMAFNELNSSAADPAFAPDGKLYFISDRRKDASGNTADYDIWFVAPLPNGDWTKPENLKNVNSDSDEYYVSFARNGNLYFSSARKGGFGEEDIYVSKLIEGVYTTPQNLGATINTEKSEYDPGIAPNEDFIVFASSGRPDGLGKADLYVSKTDNTRQWQKARNLGKPFSTSTRDYCPYCSPDTKYFFFSSEGDVKWVEVSGVMRKVK